MMISALALALLVTGDIDRESKVLAAKSFAEGEAAFAQKRFQSAALAFERAGRLVPHPSTWLNASQAWEHAKDWVRAAENCDRVLELPDVAPRFANAATKRLARIETRLARIDVEAPPAFTIRLDGGEPRRAPFSKRVLPGRHRLSWNDGDREQRRTITVAARAIERIELGLRNEPPEAALPELATTSTPTVSVPDEVTTSTESAALGSLLPLEIPPESGGLPPPPASSWIAFGAGVVALGVGVTFGAMTLSAKSDFEAGPTFERADTFDTRRNTANIAFAVSAIAGSAGLGLWIFDNLEL